MRFVQGPMQTETIDFTDGELNVGREPHCGLWIADEAVARLQATLRSYAHSGDVVLIEHSRSNASILNGRRVARGAKVMLKDGDVLQWGAVRATVRFSEGRALVTLDKQPLQAPTKIRLADAAEPLVIGKLTLDPQRREAFYASGAKASRALDLTPLEFKLLFVLAQSPGEWQHAQELERELFPSSPRGSNRVASHKHRLQKKLPPEYASCLLSRRGDTKGGEYCFDARALGQASR